MSRELMLVDLSSLAYPIWHTSQADPDPNHTSHQVVARVRSLTANHPHVAICCDSGRSFRKDVSASYKANRPEHDATLQHQITLAREQLEGDGFPVWATPGFEADDLIASATAKALLEPETGVLIVTGDKDLLQLVEPRVRAMSAKDGSIVDAEGVAAKFGVLPTQMRDYLTLVGDASDNIKGAKGIGPKKAVELLARFGSLDNLYAELDAVGGSGLGLPPACVAALKEFRAQLPVTRDLITLRADVEIPFHEIAADRVEKTRETFDTFATEGESADSDPADQAPLPTPAHVVPPTTTAGASDLAPADTSATGLMKRESTDLQAPVEWQLQPQTIRDARVLAKDMYDSRMFSAYGTPQGVLSTIMVGRELGLPAMASLRSIHNIEGRHSLSAALMAALVLKSGLAEYFEPISFSETEATFETKRKGARNPVRLTHTFEMGLKAWPKEKADWEKRFQASGWGRNPTDMCVARAQARLARMVYPDLLAGLYSPEELEEMREQRVA
jgi:5'-3' exonuclease